jgi:hypothetical protein
VAYGNGRVTILPDQIRRLAELGAQGSSAIEVTQNGSVLYFNDGKTKLSIDANGNDIHPPDQEKLC